MQSALEETSSTESGVQEEWSGLSFQNPELSNDNQPSGLMEARKNLTSWQNNALQTVPSLKASNSSSSFPGFQQSRKESDATTFRSSDSSGMPVVMDKSAGFPALDLNSQTSHDMLDLHPADKFREYKHGIQSADTDSDPTNGTPKAESTDASTPSNNSSVRQYFGLMLGPPTQRPPLNYFDLSQISKRADTSHLVPFKDQDGKRSLIFEGQQVSNSINQPNVCVNVPSQQSLSGVGFHKAPSGSPSTSDLAISRVETASEAPKDRQMNVKGSNALLEACGHVLNSQSFDCTRGQEGKIPFEGKHFSGCAEVNTSFLKQIPNLSLNPDPNTRAATKNEKADSETIFPQLTSMSQLTSVYDKYKTMLIPSAESGGQSVKNASHPLLQDAYPLYGNSSSVQMNLASTGQYERVWPATGTSSLATDRHLLVPQSKKRKLPMYEVLPWHEEASKGSSRLQDVSTVEVEWAQAAKRLKEKAEAVGDSTWMVSSKKRVILTTQLMQVLFRPAPAAILSDNASTCFDTLTYFAARLALGDACSLSNHLYMTFNMSDSLSGKSTISKASDDQNISKIVQDLINRSKEMEIGLLRFENEGSIVEIRMLSQELERFSVSNCFAKFHRQTQMAAAEAAASGGASTVPKLYPQRYVKAI